MDNTFSIYHRTSRQILRDLVYFTSGFLIPERGVIYGNPVARRPLHGDLVQRDTVIQISTETAGAHRPRIRGSKAFWYRRIDLASIVPLHSHAPAPTITGYPVDTYSLLPAINEYYGLKLTQNDVERQAYGPAEVAYLVASHASLAFSGRVQLSLSLPDIATVVDTTSIGKFEVVFDE
jgi:hypothetical protein